MKAQRYNPEYCPDSNTTVMKKFETGGWVEYEEYDALCDRVADFVATHSNGAWLGLPDDSELKMRIWKIMERQYDET